MTDDGPRSTVHGPRSIIEVLRRRAAEAPRRWAFSYLVDGEAEEVRVTYGELDRQARAVAARLQEVARPGERAVLLYPPGLEFIGGFFGCLYAGVVPVPAYPPRTPHTLARLWAIVGDAAPTVALVTASLAPRRQAAAKQAPELAALEWIASDAVPADEAGGWADPGSGADDLALIQYTSGSTGAPKGVMVSHANLLANLAYVEAAFELGTESRLVSWLPAFHDMGLIGCVLVPVYVGFPCVLLSPAHFIHRPLRWLAAISRFRATVSGGPNSAYEQCVRRTTPDERASLDLRSWELAFNGAEPVQAATLERFAKAFTRTGVRREVFFPIYGLAESTGLVSGGPKCAGPRLLGVDAAALERYRVEEVPIGSDGARTLVGCGRLDPGEQVEIVDPELVAPCGAGRVGEIWVGGPSVARGYWQRAEETEQTFRAFLADGRGPFLRTGDLGFVHDGELFVAGRLKDLIIVRGQNHYPDDVEQTVQGCHPALEPASTAAFSVEAAGGEQVVIAQEVDPRSGLDLEGLEADIRRAVLREHELAVHAVAFVRRRALPRTSSGKLQRRQCRELFLAGRLERLGREE